MCKYFLYDSVALTLYFHSSIPHSPVPTITWRKINGNIPKKARLRKSQAVLEIPNIQLEDSGTYECKAENPRGGTAFKGHLQVYSESSLTFHYQTSYKSKCCTSRILVWIEQSKVAIWHKLCHSSCWVFKIQFLADTPITSVHHLNQWIFLQADGSFFSWNVQNDLNYLSTSCFNRVLFSFIILSKYIQFFSSSYIHAVGHWFPKCVFVIIL